MSNLKVAVHLIGSPDGDITPGTVFEPAAADIDFFTATGAIRDPDEGELAIHERVSALKEKADKPEKGAKDGAKTPAPADPLS